MLSEGLPSGMAARKARRVGSWPPGGGVHRPACTKVLRGTYCSRGCPSRPCDTIDDLARLALLGTFPPSPTHISDKPPPRNNLLPRPRLGHGPPGAGPAQASHLSGHQAPPARARGRLLRGLPLPGQRRVPGPLRGLHRHPQGTRARGHAGRQPGAGAGKDVAARRPGHRPHRGGDHAGHRAGRLGGGTCVALQEWGPRRCCRRRWRH